MSSVSSVSANAPRVIETALANSAERTRPPADQTPQIVRQQIALNNLTRATIADQVLFYEKSGKQTQAVLAKDFHLRFPGAHLNVAG
tara:strand:+ start:350 stop:610 length:261 start_codon:yes stop_codon:yes gene_type:complete